MKDPVIVAIALASICTACTAAPKKAAPDLFNNRNPDHRQEMIAEAMPALSGQADAPEEELSLWYRSPAEQWIYALPVGNGRLGAMVYGGVNTEFLQLNEETLWSGRPIERDSHSKT